MDVIIRGYVVSEATWFYHSLILIVAVFFRFSRVWTLRNLDLALLLSISPGILILSHEQMTQSPSVLGKTWLLTVTVLLLIRLVTDSLWIRRPKIDANLSAHGMTFLCLAAFGFLLFEALRTSPSDEVVETMERGRNMMQRVDADKNHRPDEAGPTTDIAAALTLPLADGVASNDEDLKHQIGSTELLAAHILAVIAHFAVICGLVILARWHFESTSIGLGMATIYLMIPCTAYDVDKVHHVLPAALIVWAFVAYRRPMVSGSLIGLACGTLLFAIFLLPLWIAYYGKRGSLRFGAAVVIVAAVLFGSLMLTSADSHSFTQQLIGYVNWEVLEFRDAYQQGVENRDTYGGLWNANNNAYRITVFATFLVMTTALSIWPLKKNVEHLMAGSTAIVLLAQVWYPYQGGVYVLWYLPLLVAVVFRPRLTHLAPPLTSLADETEQQKPDRRGVQAAPPTKPLLR